VSENSKVPCAAVCVRRLELRGAKPVFGEGRSDRYVVRFFLSHRDVHEPRPRTHIVLYRNAHDVNGGSHCFRWKASRRAQIDPMPTRSQPVRIEFHACFSDTLISHDDVISVVFFKAKNFREKVLKSSWPNLF
jgi:hypothetical protein